MRPVLCTAAFIYILKTMQDQVRFVYINRSSSHHSYVASCQILQTDRDFNFWIYKKYGTLRLCFALLFLAKLGTFPCRLTDMSYKFQELSFSQVTCMVVIYELKRVDWLIKSLFHPKKRIFFEWTIRDSRVHRKGQITDGSCNSQNKEECVCPCVRLSLCVRNDCMTS